MDILSPSWFTELGMDDMIFVDQCDVMESFDEELAAVLGEDFQNTLSSECNSSSSALIPRTSSTTTLCTSSYVEPPPPPPPPPPQQTERPKKQHKINNCTRNFDHSSPTPIIINFSNNSSQPSEHGRQQGVIVGATNTDDEVVGALISQAALANRDDVAKRGQGTKKTSSRTRPPSQTYDHIIAERKRREQLSQRFVALSAIVPGLKKMDKTSVLGDAIKYLKQLQERVKILEEQATKQTMESVVLVKKSQLLIEDEGSSDENPMEDGGVSDEPLPEIEARFCDKSILIRIHCEIHKGVMVKIFSEIEKMNMAIINTSISRFGTLALDVNIIAEMEKEFDVTLNDIVRSLRSAVRRVI